MVKFKILLKNCYINKFKKLNKNYHCELVKVPSIPSHTISRFFSQVSEKIQKSLHEISQKGQKEWNHIPS